MSRLVVVMSDIEMGAGCELDDFPHSEWLGQRLLAYVDGNDGAVDFVFNGDTFDFLKTSVDGAYPNRITAAVALAKLERVQAAHPAFFDALRTILLDDRGPRSVSFLLGNHDMELAFPQVQRAIRDAIGEAVRFPGFSLEMGELHIEHGMQADSMFQVEPGELFIRHRGEPVLALPWGAVSLIDVALPLQHRLYDLDRVKPRQRVLALLPEVNDLLLNAYWQYWTQDWWQDYWAGEDPSKRISWTMAREVAYRFSTHDTSLHLGQAYKKLMRERDDLRVCVIGHLHQSHVWTWLDRRVLTTGCLRDEFAIDEDGGLERRLPKSWAEIRMDGDIVRSAQLVEDWGPPHHPGQAPRHIREVCDRIRDLLPTPSQRQALDAGQADQAQREAIAQAAGDPPPGPRKPPEN
ncbi:MAG: hypothetical protein KC912_11180 [Proteobacteria bacterium]|nr:hypothetical protein [Pseudomonadota bacterium]